jgi:WW domain-containing oxidoreductase
MDSDSVKSGANVTDFKGTIIITGANGALGLSSVEALLQNYPSHFAMLTVRDDSASDTNTTQLRDLVASFQSCQTSIEVLDLASLSSVRAFAQNVAERVSRKKIPAISAIVCNAFSWSLVDTKFSSDNYERTFQVSHLSHFVLVLMLLGSLDRTTGRIVLLGSDQHDSTKKNSLNPLGAKLPEDLDEIIKPTADKKGEEYSRGFQRYANSKLANVMFMHSLNRKLLQVGLFIPSLNFSN